MGLDEIRRLKGAAGQPKEKKVYRIPKKSAKKIKQEAAAKEEQKGESDLIKWYKARMKQMKGVCAETGEKTETKNYEYAIRSVCHILDKSKCPSVATHILNWIELHPDIHYKFDNFWNWEEKRKLKCWPEIEEKLYHLYEHLTDSEKKYFPDFLDTNLPFC